MNFTRYFIEEGVLGITLGTILGTSITNIVRDIKNLLIEPLIRITLTSLGVHHISIISSLFEVISIFAIIYVLYTYVITPVFKDDFDDIEKNEEWKDKILKEVKQIEHKLVSPSIW